MEPIILRLMVHETILKRPNEASRYRAYWKKRCPYPGLWRYPVEQGNWCWHGI